MELNDKLKNAICNNDINFLEEMKGLYFIDQRFEDENNDTLLLYSISDSDSIIYNYLIQNKANIYLTNDEGENIIHAIVFSGDNKRLQEIVENHDININHKAKDGATPLLLAISLNKTEIAQLLISYGADINIADEDGITPLHLAVQSENLNLVEYLLKNGADFNLKTNNGNLALALAVNSGNVNIIKLLFKRMYD
jgi:ankyrin repeat protein